MTSTPMTPPPGERSDDEQSLTNAARQEAGDLTGSVADAGAKVAETAKEQAGEVLADVRHQARELAGRAGEELSSQATSQQQRAAKSLRAVSDEFQSMAGHGEATGLGSQLVRHGSDLTRQLADYLDSKEPAQLLDDARGFARRHPGGFLLGAMAAGMLAGRLTRAMASDAGAQSPEVASTEPVDAGLVPPPVPRTTTDLPAGETLPPAGRTETW